MHEAVLLLGSNIDPEPHLARALELLRARFDVRAASRVYRSPAVGGRAPQPDFLNQALRLRTDCPPRARREACRRLEERLGRQRGKDRFAPRTIDIDVILFDDVARDFGAFRLPDADLDTHAHVLVPAAEIAPAWRHPRLGADLATLAGAMDAAGLDVL
jgi:2-amino-4-hydroxy-6-hydroxymethyldihydropteridine diphosphokinase